MAIQHIDPDNERREELVARMLAGDMSIANNEWVSAFAIDTEVDAKDIPLQDIDPSHPDLFGAERQWDHFERLRNEDPIHYHPTSQFGPYWSVTRYADIMEVDKRHDLFSSQQRLGGITLGDRPRADDDPFAIPMFIQEDPPRHDEQRRVVTPMFLPRNLASLEPVIRERAAAILDNLPLNQEFDWVSSVSMELTSQMLATLFDIPQADRTKLIYWSDTIQNLGDPERFATPEEGFNELWDCLRYFTPIFEARKSYPAGFDLISLMAGDDSMKDISPRELLGNILLLIVGGNETTRNSISGGVLALNRNPDQYKKLQANPGLITSMVPEIIRWQTPIPHMMRIALEETVLGGKQISKGDRVVMWYASGNRDERHIHRANDFLIDRAQPRTHMSFGYGIHRCVGNRLAEMQLRVCWEEIVKRFSRVEVTGEPVLQKSCAVSGIQSLPVRVVS